MKRLSNPIFLSCLSTGLGLLCLAARLWLMNTGFDGKGLLMSGHAGSTLSYILTAALALLLLAALIAKPQRFSFRSNRISSAGAAVSILCLIQTAVCVLSGIRTPLAIAAGILAILAALCGAALAVFRFLGKRAWLPLYLPAILTLMLQFLYCFRLWGAEPQLQRYFFSLGAQIFVLLTLYYRAAAECKMSTHTLYTVFSCAGIFFGLAAAADGGISTTYGIWALCILLDNLSIRLRLPGGKKS